MCITCLEYPSKCSAFRGSKNSPYGFLQPRGRLYLGKGISFHGISNVSTGSNLFLNNPGAMLVGAHQLLFIKATLLGDVINRSMCHGYLTIKEETWIAQSRVEEPPKSFC